MTEEKKALPGIDDLYQDVSAEEEKEESDFLSVLREWG